MGKQHIPDEILMQQVLTTLNRGPMTVAGLCIAIRRHPKNVRQAVNDLMHFGKVEKHYDGLRFKLVGSGHRPGPSGGEAA